jgi:hypothetical protein
VGGGGGGCEEATGELERLYRHWEEAIELN